MRNRLFLLTVSFCFLTAGSAWTQDRISISADFDGNGAVDFVDFSRFMAQFGRSFDERDFDRTRDLNGDGSIDGEDAFLFADVFADNASEASVRIFDGPNANAMLRLDPHGNGFLIYLENIDRIGGYRIVFDAPEENNVRSVQDHLGMGMLPPRRTLQGVEIVGLVLGNRFVDREELVDQKGLIATVTFDTTGVDVVAVHLRGPRFDLNNHNYRGQRNAIHVTESDNILVVDQADVEVSPRVFNFGHIELGETASRTFVVENTFAEIVIDTLRNLSVEIATSGSEIAVAPRSVGVLTDLTEGLGGEESIRINMAFTPMQLGIFSGFVDVKTNRPEREIIRAHVMSRVHDGSIALRHVAADFDDNGAVDYGDFDQLIARFGQTLRLSKYDLDRDGVVDADDAFLLADVITPAFSERVGLIPGVNREAAVRVQGAGEDFEVFALGLERLGGYRIVLNYNPEDVELRWARDRAGGGILPIHKTATGAEIVGMGFGARLEVPDHAPLAEFNVLPLKDQPDVQSLVSVADVVLRGHRGERDTVKVVRIAANGLDVIPRVIDFGAVRLGTTAVDSMRVFNLNDRPVGFTIVSQDSAVTTKPRTVGAQNPGRGWPVQVTYTAISVGPFSGTLLVSAEAGDPSPVVVQIMASVTDLVRVAPDVLNFGDVFVGQSQSQSVTVTNPNVDPLRIDEIEFSSADSNFAIGPAAALPRSVAGEGGTETLGVRFAPRVQGAIRDTLRISGGDTTYVIPLSGRGIQARVRVEYDELDFGTLRQDRDSLQTVRVFNAGNIALVMAQVTVSGDGFTVVDAPDLPDTLSVGDARAVRVGFMPKMSGDHEGILRIAFASPAQEETREVPLYGTGQTPSPDFDGDGEVGFADFVLFVQAFDSEQFNPIYDLDGDGEIGFSDFIAFASAFGQTVG